MTVSIKVHIGHGVDRKRNVEPVFVCLARCGLDADAGRDASDHNMCDAQSLQVFVETRVRERSPRTLRHSVVFRLLVYLRNKIGPIGGKLPAWARLFRPSRRSTGDVDKHHRQPMATECIGQRAGVLHSPIG